MGKKVEKIKKICPNCGREFEVRPCEDKRMECCCKQCNIEYHSTEKVCLNCGKTFRVPNCRKEAKFCCKECRKEYKYKQALETRICRYCNKEYQIQKSNDDLCCSNECYIAWKDEHSWITYKCDHCGKEFEILKSKLNGEQEKFYCCHKCSTEDNIQEIYVKCDNCGKEIRRTKSKIRDYNFCCIDCRSEYQSKTGTTIKTCEMCGNEYSVKNSRLDFSRFCSNECKSKWQSINLIGENSPTYEGVTANCSYCGELLHIKKYRKKIQKNFFCNRQCQTKYFQISANRTSKQRLADKKLARRSILNNQQTLTKPHILVNNILDKLNINYRIEELVKYFKIDTYLIDYNLGIEVNGDFWHCSPIRYKNKISYNRQLKGISRDKAKHTYVKKKYNYEILYIWESDIEKYSDVCENLIIEYIKRNGVLDNYHSFNYYLDEFGILKLKDNLIIPYQDLKRSQYRDKIQIKCE